MFKTILLTTMLSLNMAMAMTSMNEVMDIKMLLKLDKNVYLLKRGIQDGLGVGEHLRISDSQGFISRAVVIGLDQVQFLVYTYHRYRSGALHEKNDLILSWVHQKFIPASVKERISNLYLKDYLQKINYISWKQKRGNQKTVDKYCLLYTSPSPRDQRGSRMPSSA